MESLAERDGALREAWVVFCLSRELDRATRRSRPISREIYDRKWVGFRDQNHQPVVMLDRCLHRNAELSEGRVDKGCLKCPYHGWEYDSSGAVARVPSEGVNTVSRSFRNPARPALEQDGCVWIWAGDSEPGERKPPRLAYVNDAGWQHYIMITDFENEVTHLAENFMDVPHTVFVHRGWFRSPKRIRVPIRVEVENGEVLVTYEQKEDSIGFTRRFLNPTGAEMVHTDRFIFPNTTRVDYRFGDRGYVIMSTMAPVSTLKTRVYTLIAFRVGILGRLLKPFFRFYTRQVIEQDVEIMANQGRSFKRDFHPNFEATEADVVHAAIERLRHWGKRGDSQVFGYQATVEKVIWI